jgi:undecaprenyl-diphosphatase
MSRITQPLASPPRTIRAALPLVGGAGTAFVAGVAFLDLAENVREGDITEFDDAVLRWVSERRGPLLTRFFRTVTLLGSWPVLTLLTSATSIGMLRAGERRRPVTLALSMIGAPALIVALRLGYGRARPQVMPHLQKVSTASFPSGHTLASVVFFVTLALLATGQMPRKRQRVLVVAPSAAAGALVAISRVYLGVHFASDVVGGALVGVAWSMGAVTVDRLLRGRVP